MNIKEVSEQYDISIETLRYYERIGLIPPVHRDQNGYRDYTKQDLRWVYYAKALRRAEIPVETLIEYVKLFQEGEHTREARKQLLIEEEKKLVIKIQQMQEALDYLRTKINNYDGYIKNYEECLKGEEE